MPLIMKTAHKVHSGQLICSIIWFEKITTQKWSFTIGLGHEGLVTNMTTFMIFDTMATDYPDKRACPFDALQCLLCDNWSFWNNMSFI